MKKKFIVLPVILIFVLGISVYFFTKKKLKTDKEVSGNLKIITLTKKTKGKINDILKIILDVEDYKNFMPNIKKSEVFDKKNNCIFTYTVLAAPIMSERDYVLKMCVEKNTGKKLRISWKTIKNKKYPPNKDFVRITQNTGSWRIKKTDDKNIEVTYSLSIDPKTNLPDFMLDKANKKTMNNIISALENRIKDKN